MSQTGESEERAPSDQSERVQEASDKALLVGLFDPWRGSTCKHTKLSVWS